MQYWIILLACALTSCIRDSTGWGILLRDELVAPLMEITACITGVQKKVDAHGNIIGEDPFEINFQRAHLLFRDIEHKLIEWPKITGYPIAQSLLKELHELLNELEQHIETLSDGQDKNEFRRERNQLAKLCSH